MNFLIVRNILVLVAVVMWLIIGLVALIIFLKNKFGNCHVKTSASNVYKQTYVQGSNDKSDTNKSDALDTTNNKSNLCL